MSQDFSRQNLRNRNFTERDFTGANFSRTDLRGANFKEANLAGADFSKADLRGTTFARANLTAAKFVKSRTGVRGSWLLINAVLLLVVFVATSFTQWVFAASVTIFLGDAEVSQLNHVWGILLLIPLSYALWSRRKGNLGSRLEMKVAAICAFAIALGIVTASAGEGAAFLTITVSLFVLVVILSAFIAIFIAEMLASIAISLFSVPGALLFLLVGATVETGFCWYISILPQESPEGANFALVFGVGIAAVWSFAGLGFYGAWQALRGNLKFRRLRDFTAYLLSWGGTSFCHADLTDANFTQADLQRANFRGANLTRTCFRHAQGLNLARRSERSLQRNWRIQPLKRFKKLLRWLKRVAILLALFLAALSPWANRMTGLAYSEFANLESRSLEEKTNGYRRATQLDPNNALYRDRLGRILKEQGDWDGAIAAYRKAIEIDPEDARSYQALGEALEEQGNPNGAISAYRKAAVLTSNPTKYKTLGDFLRKNGQLEGAIWAYRQAIALEPNNGFYYQELGEIFEKQNKSEEAIAAYRKMVEFSPHKQTYKVLGDALSEQGKSKEAIAAYCQGFKHWESDETKEALLKSCQEIKDNPKNVTAHTNLSRTLESQSKRWEKKQEFVSIGRHLLELAPQNADAQIQAGLAFFRNGLRKEGRTALHAAWKLLPQEVEAHNKLGNAFLEQMQWGDAISVSREALQLDANSAEAHYNLGRGLRGKAYLIRQYKKDESWSLGESAIAALRKAIQLNPKYSEAYFQLGWVFEDRKQFDQAFSYYRQALQLNPKHSEAYRKLGYALREQGKLEQAIAVFRQATHSNPQSSDTYSNLGLALEEQGQLNEAIANYRQALQLDPDNSLASIALKEVLQEQGKSDEIIALYREKVERYPNIGSYRGLAAALYRQEKWEEASEFYQKAIDAGLGDPNPVFFLADIYADLGDALLNSGKRKDAIAAYNQAITLNSEEARYYFYLGDALRESGQLKRAISAYRTAIALNPTKATTYNALGIALKEQGKLEEAIANYRKAIQLDPQWLGIYHNLSNVLEEQGKFDEVIALYRQAVQHNPTNSWVYIRLGDVLEEQGKFDEAIANYRKATQLDLQDTRAYEVLGNALKVQGKFDEAVSAYRQVLKFDPDNKRAADFLEQTQCQLNIQRNPQLAKMPERLPSVRDERLAIQKRSVVRVITQSDLDLGLGTGWVVKRQGNKAWIVTNRHVVSGEQQIEIEFHSTPPSGQCRKRQLAKLIHTTNEDDPLDLAVLEVTEIPSDIKPLPLVRRDVAIRTSIYLIGHPLYENWRVSEGRILEQVDEELRLSAVAGWGSSGGPALDKQHRVVGVIYQMSMSLVDLGQFNYSIAMPSKAVADRLEQWGVL